MRTILSIAGDKKLAFKISDIVRMTNFTRRQISYWEKTGVLRATVYEIRSDGKKAAVFPRTEVLKALVFCEMKAKGFTMPQIRQVARNLHSFQEELLNPNAYVLSDGFSVYLAKSEGQVVDILRHARQMLLVPIKDQLKKISLSA